MEDTALDPRDPDVRVEFGMARAEFAQLSATIAYAEQIAAIDATLDEARAFPEVFVGKSLLATAPEAAEFAERAAIADLAVRLSLSEQTIRNQAHEAHTLLRRAPAVWAAFREGDIATPNARTVADLIDTLPEECWAVFEAAIFADAKALAPARFRTRARVARDRVLPEPAEERRRRRAEERRVYVEADLDGMSWFSALLPSEVAERAMAHLNHIADSLAARADETRTKAQLRADAAGDLLAGVLGSGAGVGVSVGVIVPVLTLLDRGDEPGILEGYGPIDADTARRLAGHAPSFTRILTDPVTGTVLDVDRKSYRVPADLKRWLGIRDVQCRFVGCGRNARDCELDHTVDWARGGTTSADNLAHLCLPHHRLKHMTDWTVEHTPAGLTWTSPTGEVRTADPPPF